MDGIFDPRADSLLSDADLMSLKSRYTSFNEEQELSKISHAVFHRHIGGFSRLVDSSNAIEHLVYGNKNFVIRINVSPRSETYLAVEGLLYAAWGTAGVPTPKRYASHLRDNEFLYDFTVDERVGTGTLEAHPEHAQAAGAFLARLHTLTMPGFGYFSVDDAKKGILRGLNSSWQDFVFTKLEENVEYLVTNTIIDRELAIDIEEAMLANKELARLGQGVALHGDYHNANILFESESKRIVGAIDLSQAKIGDPIFDIAFYSTYYTDEIITEFLNGYFGDIVRPADLAQKLAFYQLRICLSKAKLRKRFGYHDRIPAAVLGMRKAIKILKA